MRKFAFIILILSFQHFALPAQTKLPDSLKLSIQTSSDTAQVLSLYRAGEFFLSQNEPDSALAYIKKTYELSKAIGFENGKLGSYFGLSDVYLALNNIPEAANYLFKALEVFIKRKDDKACANIYRNIGNMYLTHSNYPEALKNYLEFLRFAEKIRDDASIARAYGSIGMVHMKQGDYESALKYFFHTTAIQERLDRKSDLSKTYNFVGNLYDEMKNYDKALEFHYKSLQLKKEINDEEGMGASYQNIAGAQTNIKKYDEALENFGRAMTIHQKYEDVGSVIRTHISLSLLYFYMNKIKEAERACLKALELDIEKDPELQASIHQNLSHIYELQRKFDRAFYHYKQHIAFRDSMLNDENIKKTVELEMTYEFDKKEAQAKIEQEKKEAIAKADANKQKLILWSVSAILILVFFFAIFAYRSYLAKQRANQSIVKQKDIIEQKQKEILDSIHYARRIQSALISSDTYIDKNIKRLKT